MAITDKFELGGMPVDQVYGKIIEAGIPKVDAAILVGGWILQNAGRTRRVFDFATQFPGVDPACTSAFAGRFDHEHWIDGQSVVQAEETTTEQGFNTRFDNIKADIAGLSAELAKAFTCLAHMRRDVRALLDELRMEVNRINSDIYSCCAGAERVVAGPTGDFVQIDRNKFLGTTMFFDKPVSVWQTLQGTMVLPVTLGPGTNPIDDPRVRRPAMLAEFIEMTPEVRTIFAAGGLVTKERFIETFGRLRTKEGFAVLELVKILPDRSSYATAEAMLAAVAEREAAALRTSGDTRAILAAAFGVGTEVPSVGKASVEKLNMIPAPTRSALVASGIDTVEKLAAASPRELSVRLTRAGVETSAAEVGGWAATARTLTHL